MRKHRYAKKWEKQQGRIKKVGRADGECRLGLKVLDGGEYMERFVEGIEDVMYRGFNEAGVSPGRKKSIRSKRETRQMRKRRNCGEKTRKGEGYLDQRRLNIASRDERVGFVEIKEKKKGGDDERTVDVEQKDWDRAAATDLREDEKERVAVAKALAESEALDPLGPKIEFDDWLDTVLERHKPEKYIITEDEEVEAEEEWWAGENWPTREREGKGRCWSRIVLMCRVEKMFTKKKVKRRNKKVEVEVEDEVSRKRMYVTSSNSLKYRE
jgi:hypothetical protein